MEDLDEPAVTGKAETLRGIRRELMQHLASLPSVGSIIAMQQALLREHGRTSQTQAGRELLKEHRSKLRAIGDALTWQVLPAHAIRTLAKHPGRPAPPPVDTDDAAFVMRVVDRLAGAGRVPIIADLTNVLLVGDIVALGPSASVEVVECKNTRIPTRLPSSGRLARQRQRGETLTNYLRESVMPIADEAPRFAAALGIPASASPPQNLVAMDMVLPEPHPEWLDTAYAQYEESSRGVAVVEIGPGDYLILADPRAIESDEIGEVVDALPSMNKRCLAVHLEHLAEPLPYCRSILSYPVDWKLRYDLLEANLVMIRLVDLAIFETRGDDGIGLVLREDLSLVGEQDGYSQIFSHRFVHEVLTGPISAAETLSCLRETLRQSDRDLAPLVREGNPSGRSGESDLAGRGFGSDVRYTTAYPAPDGELAFVSSATEVGLGAVPGVTHVEFYPTTGRLIVHGEDGVLLDKEFPAR
ncbi:hypothetical protein PSN13_05202 [Micromonospora saelicesensis]|uniref:Uncharacterized protein n=1 Tax=Micromonospora saelicesensis TaxID=285676 RepID=A0A328NMR7_9ACTN|nr:hypothetical protein [Micromonospora saelicesensis]RAO30003.1 hypothetical protein PSN13_05202 [Micromonospora saelicesensis]